MNIVVEGSVSNITEIFLDEFDDPIYPDPSFDPPSATLYDLDNSIIFKGVATPTTVQGEWQIDLSIPNMDLLDRVMLTLEWLFHDEEGTLHRTKSLVAVDPASENRISDVVVLYKKGITDMTFTMPIFVQASDTLTASVYLNNEPVLEDIDLMSLSGKIITSTKATFTLPINLDSTNMRLEPLNITVTHKSHRTGVLQYHTRNAWVLTPQILTAVSMLSQFVDKAKIQQVIPALEYTQGDMVNCLYRGLSMFNSYPPYLTSFRGTNMQGTMLECWIICSSYVALSTQMLAEGAHAFDFAGQDVNFNVDRTPAIESALGRIDQQLENLVKPYKKLIGKAGITTGDGSVGGTTISTARAFGKTSIINSPTSKLGRGPGAWIRSPLRNSGRS